MILAPETVVLAGAFVAGVGLGVAMAWSDFCTMGAVADLTLMGDGRRLRAWALAGAVAIAAYALVTAGGADAGFASARIDYAAPVTLWSRQALGGLLFGAGMTLAAGCVSKNLVRVGTGSGKAAVTLATVAITAWAMTAGRGYERVFASWLNPLAVDLRRFGVTDQSLPTLAGLSGTAALVATWLIAATVAGVTLANARFRGSVRHWLGATIVGALIGAGWWLTRGPVGTAWAEQGLFADRPPPDLGAQSFTFVNPLGEFVRLLGSGQTEWFTFGVAGALGVATGALVHAFATGRFRPEWFVGPADAVRHVAGGVLMGTGGILGLGCTVGQGLTGLSTLAAGSLVATIAIVVGAFAAIRLDYALPD